MEKKEVRNITENELVIPEVGVVGAGETIEVSKDFNNPNFETIKSTKEEEVEKKVINKNKE